MYGVGVRREERSENIGREVRSEVADSVRLGHDLRFVLVAVGGGGIRIGREIARQHLPYLETVAINCDPSVSELPDFDRKIFVSSSGGHPTDDTGGAPSVGAQRARAAQPALDRLFDGAAFVTIVASLGGGTGTGALPTILETAARSAQALKVFVVKPFECESDRRALSGRALAGIDFLGEFANLRDSGRASLEVLDNEQLARASPHLPFARLDRHWAERITSRIVSEMIRPAELALEAERLALLANSPGLAVPPVTLEPPEEIRAPAPPRLAPLTADAPGGPVELTFEILPDPPSSRP